MAEVWLAEHKHNGRKAAIKVLKPVALSDKDAENLFLREGQVLASFDHRNIVKIYDNSRIGDLAFIIMEHLPGGTLLERMQRGPIRVDEALGLITQIAGALEAAHKQQVIHRDLKPANVMLRDETTPVLTDFGAVRMLDRSTIYGRDGGIIGTPIYMSPEQITGERLTGSSDLYALGVLFHELLTGRLPYPGGSISEIATQHLFAPVPQLPPALAMLQPVLEQMLAKKAELRFATAQQFIDALRSVFLTHDALRRQVGFSGTSMAWSSQLRALGFVLDPVQKDEVRRAQGDFLQTRSAPQAVEVPRPRTVASAPVEPVASQAAEAQRSAYANLQFNSAPPKSSRTGLWLTLTAAGLLLAAGGVYWARPAEVSQVIQAATEEPKVSDVLAARESYTRAAGRLQQFAKREKQNVKLTLDSAAEFAQQGVRALDEQRVATALTAYRNALDIVQRDGISLLGTLEQSYAKTAQVSLKSGRLEEAKDQLERAKQVRALRDEWGDSK